VGDGLAWCAGQDGQGLNPSLRHLYVLFHLWECARSLDSIRGKGTLFDVCRMATAEF
jgi:hypothetical protein